MAQVVGRAIEVHGQRTLGLTTPIELGHRAQHHQVGRAALAQALQDFFGASEVGRVFLEPR